MALRESYDSDDETEKIIIDRFIAENEDLIETLSRLQRRRKEVVERLKQHSSDFL